jgi:predicted GH43/DUF377 family glycosyl hydrolase
MTTYENAPAHSILTNHAIPVERLKGGLPYLEPIETHDWESGVVLNPAAQLVTDPEAMERIMAVWNLSNDQRQHLRIAGGLVAMIYRAQGVFNPEKGCSPSSAGFCILTPELDVVWRNPSPIIHPDADYHRLGVEDARCTDVDGVFHLYYTGYGGDLTAQTNRVRICHATTMDFKNWSLNGPIDATFNNIDNKNALLLPGTVHGRHILFHRPMEGLDPKSMHYASAPSPLGPWTDHGRFMASFRYEEFTESWIGAGGPPIPIGHNRFLVIYHQGHYDALRQREYDLSATIIRFDEQLRIEVGKRIEPLIRPAENERTGHSELGVDNVVFTCANYVWDGYVYIPYAGADSRIFGARVPLAALLD